MGVALELGKKNEPAAAIVEVLDVRPAEDRRIWAGRHGRQRHPGRHGIAAVDDHAPKRDRAAGGRADVEHRRVGAGRDDRRAIGLDAVDAGVGQLQVFLLRQDLALQQQVDRVLLQPTLRRRVLQ